MHMKPLIVGVDPGTTVGYAAIDFDGKLVKADSAKELDLGSLIAKLIPLGKVILVGGDKERNPEFVEKLAVKLGARLISPDYDLKVEEKRLLAKGYPAKNQHEIDALASALSAWKKMRAVLQKIDYFLEMNRKMELKDSLIALVIGRDLNIRDAFELLGEPKREEAKIIREAVEKRNFTEQNYLWLYQKLRRSERERFLVSEQNSKLQREIAQMEKEYAFMLKKASKASQDLSMRNALQFKESRIRHQEKVIGEKEKEIARKESSLTTLLYFLSRIGEYVLLKKLDNLGSAELLRKKTILNIVQGDILLVKDPDIFSEQAVGPLREKVAFVVYRKPVSEKVRQKLPFSFIDAKLLELEEDHYFAIAKKEDFISAQQKAKALINLVEAYQRERNSKILPAQDNASGE
ncbi:DUF460 domain-containing protein [Candidatus Woesearchaeota archaeon]|nr:DUF460 domain-containing protein [Candidatus Woesearchaeota archaeon]